MKRWLDVVSALTALLIASPVLAVIAVVIKLHDGGPIFYRGVRVGRFGAPYRIFKFRTMVVNAEQIGGPSTADDDRRITSVGRWLRKYKLDELPQLFNILLGHMSIVGPRPEVPQYIALLTDEERVILSVRPGLTDWATLWNPDEGAILAGSADPEQVYLEKIRPEKVRLQVEYVRQRSFWIDLVIVLQTLRTVLFRTTPPVARMADRET